MFVCVHSNLVLCESVLGTYINAISCNDRCKVSIINILDNICFDMFVSDVHFVVDSRLQY